MRWRNRSAPAEAAVAQSREPEQSPAPDWRWPPSIFHRIAPWPPDTERPDCEGAWPEAAHTRRSAHFGYSPFQQGAHSDTPHGERDPRERRRSPCATTPISDSGALPRAGADSPGVAVVPESCGSSPQARSPGRSGPPRAQPEQDREEGRKISWQSSRFVEAMRKTRKNGATSHPESPLSASVPGNCIAPETDCEAKGMFAPKRPAFRLARPILP